jgi:hypothetical protein
VQPINRLHAQPTNRTGGDILANGLLATFRMANWGSQPDWDDPVLAAQLWQPIRGGTDVPNGGTIANNADGDNTFTWQLDTSPGELPAFAPQVGTPAKRNHQCILVQLKPGPTSGSINFINDSLYANFDVVPASTFERDAEISVKTLGQLGAAPDRDVYLWVETLNMPTTTTPDEERRRRAEVEGDIAKRREAVSKEIPPGSPPEDGEGGGGDGPIDHVPRKGEGTPEWLQPMPEDVKRLEPSYRVHVWHDTGDTVTEENGSVRKVLKAQTSFGYLVEHSGPLYGWAPQLTGPGLTELAPNFYRLRIPAESTADVHTKIVAHEKPPKKGGCIPAILAFLAALIAFIRKLLKK